MVSSTRGFALAPSLVLGATLVMSQWGSALAHPTTSGSRALIAGPVLLQRAAVVMVSRGSAHYTARGTVNVPGAWSGPFQGGGNASFVTQTIGGVFTNGNPAAPRRGQFVTTTTRVAFKLGVNNSNPGAWVCSTIAALPSNSPLKFLSLSSLARIAGRSQTVGVATVDGQLTWHVVSPTTLSGRPGKTEFFVAQFDSTLVQVITTLTDGEHLQIDLSNYGAPVNVHLPKKCRA